jgi:putative DNA primase/helicase
MTLLDADGGTGKTTFAIGLAASLSVGYDPFNQSRRQPGKTLIFAAEDSTEDIGVLFAAMGGERGYLLHYAEPFVIDEKKLALLEETIDDSGIDLVVFDPLFAVLGVRDFNDAAAVTPALERLREIAKRTGAAFLNIRHTNRSAGLSTDHRADVGIGSAMIRNAHREVLRVRFHPDTEKYKGLRVVTAHKGSIRHEDAEPLGWRRVGDSIEWVPDPDMTAFNNPEFGVPSTKESASVWLANYLGETGHKQSDIREAAEKAGLSWRTVERAKKELNVVSYRPTVPGEWCWKMPEKQKEYNPFEDY